MGLADALPEQAWWTEVDDEWCLADTLRHLVFVTDAWLRRPILGEARPFWPGGLGATDIPPSFTAAAGLDRSAVPTVAQIRAVRAERTALLTDTLAALTVEELERRCQRNRAPGYPADTTRLTVGQCLHTVLSEEWAHHSFAARDLESVAARLRHP